MKTSVPLETKQVEKGRAAQKEIDVQVEKYFQGPDRAAVQQLAERYRTLVPPERIKAMQDLPTKFEDRKQFDDSFRAAGGESPESGLKVVGYARGTLEPAHVATDQLEIDKTIRHERLHQMSAPEAKQILGTRLYEGATEDLAIKNLGTEPMADAPESYPEERAVARQIREVCGDEAVEKLYFQGDARELRQCLEKRLGPGALDRMRHELKRLPSLEAPAT